jgi:DNA-binding transcriptional LysR family regulator
LLPVPLFPDTKRGPADGANLKIDISTIRFFIALDEVHRVRSLAVTGREHAGIKARPLDRLRALEVLLRTRSSSSAALELGVAPSTVSKTLGHLRSELNDQLLMRRGAQTILTRRAQRLVEPLGATLGALDRLLEDDGKETRRASAAIAMRDHCALALAPAFVGRLAAESPQTALKILPYERERLLDELMRGAVDVAVAVDPPNVRDLNMQLLYRESFVCVTRDRASLTLDQYLRAEHVATSHSGSTHVNAALARLGHQRRIVAHVPNFATLLQAAESRGLCATLPESVLLAGRPPNLFVHPTPLPISELLVSMVWHRRRQQDPEIRWLRDLLLSASKTVASALGYGARDE